MLTIENIRVRKNIEASTNNLIGWAEMVLNIDGKYPLYLNNVKVKIKDGDGVLITREEYPYKVIIGKDGLEKKVFFVKPVNNALYELINKAVAECIRKEICR